MEPWLEPSTIFLTLAGSQAHGTADERSDLDVRGACIAPLRVRVSPFVRFEQHEGTLEEPLLEHLRAHLPGRPRDGERAEVVVYDLAKLLRLAASQNPNALEILFADERDWILARPPWERVVEVRQRFLTRDVASTYAGYARAQLARIRTHRGWLLDPPKAPPTRADFGLAETPSLGTEVQGRIAAAVREHVASLRLDDLSLEPAARIELDRRLGEVLAEVLEVRAEDVDGALGALAERALGLPRAVREVLEGERAYRKALAGWHAFLDHQQRRNPARAALEARFGYDTKHAMHLVRLYRTGVEVLETGTLEVRRADAGELRAIRDGALSFDALVRLTEALEQRLVEAKAKTTLPAAVDRRWLEPFVVSLLTP